MNQQKTVTQLSLTILLSLLTLSTQGDTKANFEKHKQEILKEPSLIRYYTFEEGQGEEVRNHKEIAPGKQAMSGGPLGSLYILRVSPYGLQRQNYMNTSVSMPSPEWTKGRWPWKSALTNGLQPRCLFRSGVYGKNFNQFTLETWIRVHESDKKKTGCSILDIGSGYGKGLAVKYGSAGKGHIMFKMGTPKGSEWLTASPFSAGVWHHLVCSYDGKEMKIFIDGKLAKSKPYVGNYIPPVKDGIWGFGIKPFHEGRGTFLFVGGKPSTRDGNARFDMGELAIYESSFTPEKAAAHYASGKPAVSAEQQLADFRELRKETAKKDSISINIPKETWGYFPIGTEIPVTIAFSEKSGFDGNYKIDCKLTNLKGKEVWHKNNSIDVKREQKTQAKISLPADNIGIYFLDVVIKGSANKIIKQLPEKYCIGITIKPVAKKDISPLNPLGIQACLNPWMSRVMPLDRQFVHSVKGIPRYKEKAAKLKANGPQFPAMFYCLAFSHHKYKDIGPKEEEEIREFVTTAVRELKDTAFCWEITNEPNGKFKPETYMKLLKICSEIIRKETPDIRIVAPGASPSGIPFINRLLELGASKYIDVVSFHNYTGTPIHSYRWNNTCNKLKKVIVEHAHKPLPIWNSESGVFCVPRIGEKAMTVAEAVRVGFKKSSNTIKDCFLTSMPTFTEHQAAAIQIQNIVLDLAAGYKKYIRCQGPSLPGMEKINTLTLPTEIGIALTSLSTVVNKIQKAEELPVSSMEDACVIITDKDGKRTAIAFSDKTPTLSFKVEPGKTYNGMDMMGNSLSWKASEAGLIMVQLGEDPVYIFDVPKEFKQITPLNVSCPEKLIDGQALKGTVEVSNPFTSELNGTLIAKPIKGAEISIDKTQIKLAPGNKAIINFSLKAEKLKRRQYELQFSLKDGEKMIATSSVMFDSPGSITQVPEVTARIILDGNDDEWKSIPVDVAKDEECVVKGKPNLAELWLPQWRGNEDLSFSAQYAWRKDDALYLFIKVKDNKPMPAPKDQEGRAFLWDCLELFFDSRPYGKRGGPVSIGADQVIIIPKTNDQVEKCVAWFPEKEHAVIDVEFVGRKTEDGYLLEGKITPKKGSSFKLLSGSQFCMDLFFDDIDNPEKKRKAAMALHGVYNNYTDSGKWGRYQLEPKTK